MSGRLLTTLSVKNKGTGLDKRIFPLVLALLWPWAGHPVSFISVGELLDQCDLESDGCYAYLNGIADGVDIVEIWRNVSLGFCIPEGVGSIQLRTVFLNFAGRYPELRHENAASMVLNSFREAWPCKPAGFST